MDRALLVRRRLLRLMQLLLLLLLPQAWKLCRCSCMLAAIAFRHPIRDGGSDDLIAGHPEKDDDEEADRFSLLRFMHGSDRCRCRNDRLEDDVWAEVDSSGSLLVSRHDSSLQTHLEEDLPSSSACQNSTRKTSRSHSHSREST